MYMKEKLFFEEYFIKRLISLRIKKDVSARDMSLNIGQSESYINKIENGQSLPSMDAFFNICEYFKITPAEFFDESLNNPKNLKALREKLEETEDVIKDAIKLCDK